MKTSHFLLNFTNTISSIIGVNFHALYSVYPRNKKGHGNFIKKGHFKRALSDQKGHSKRALIDQKGHINFAISVLA